MTDSFFWMAGILASDLQEISQDPASLDRPGFWAVFATYEGEWSCARFATVVRSEFPPAQWSGVSGQWQTSFNRQDYCDYVERIREQIAIGEVYQVNACRILSIPFEGQLDGLFHEILARNPSPYAAYLRIPGMEIASASPELFLRRTPHLGEEGERKTTLVSSPIKGTAKTPDFGEKDRSENVMIVDLIRNDLGQICETGSVEVARLLGIESHPGLFHLVSDVTGTMRSDATWSDINEALMPPGSISGAPKSSAVRIIRENEAVSRGPYCGAFGWAKGDEALLSVGIRLFWNAGDGYLRFGTGAGITWSSDAQAEWEETVLKAGRLIGIAGGQLPEIEAL